jgi:Putative collagen-binding domain of a collagenase
MPWVSAGNVRNSPGGCSSGPNCTTLDSRWDAIRKNIGYMLDYANDKLALAKMTPRGSLSSTGFCLANAAFSGAEYLVYAPSGGSFTVNLSATTRTLNVEWLNPAIGAITAAAPITGGSSSHSFTAPFSGDAVLYLLDAAGHGT